MIVARGAPRANRGNWHWSALPQAGGHRRLVAQNAPARSPPRRAWIRSVRVSVGNLVDRQITTEFVRHLQGPDRSPVRRSARWTPSFEPPRQRHRRIPSRATAWLRLADERTATRRKVAFSISGSDGAARERTQR